MEHNWGQFQTRLSNIVAKGNGNTWEKLSDAHGDPLRDHVGDHSCVNRKCSHLRACRLAVYCVSDLVDCADFVAYCDAWRLSA